MLMLKYPFSRKREKCKMRKRIYIRKSENEKMDISGFKWSVVFQKYTIGERIKKKKVTELEIEKNNEDP